MTSAIDKLSIDAAVPPQPVQRLLKIAANDRTATFTRVDRELHCRREFDTGPNALSLNKLRRFRCPSGT